MSTTTNAGLSIVQLEAENVKRLRAVRITPDGSLVTISGKNGAGKSTVLDCIAMAFGGGAAIPSKPLRNGAKSGRIEIELSNGHTVTRTLTENGTYLTVKDAEGVELKSPQKVLDAIYAGIAFDPQEFARLRPAEQRRVLVDLAGLDLDGLDALRRRVYDERTAVNRSRDRAEAAAKSMPFDPAAPKEEVSLVDLMAEHQAALAVVAENARLKREVEACRHQLERAIARHDQLRLELEQAARVLENTRVAYSNATNAVTDLVTPDLEAIAARIDGIEAANARYRNNAARDAKQAEADNLAEESSKLTDRIEQIDAAKAKALAEAPLPIEGLSVTESGVSYRGVPLEQASQAERIAVSVAIGMALNPKLRVLLIRDGSLMDADTLAWLAGEAEARGYQVWLERVGTEAEPGGVLIADGEVACSS